MLIPTWVASTLPATHVTARMSASGDAQAYSSARLSSMPVSQSMMRGTLEAGISTAAWPVGRVHRASRSTIGEHPKSATGDQTAAA